MYYVNFSRLLYNQECLVSVPRIKSVENAFPCYETLLLIMVLSILVLFSRA